MRRLASWLVALALLLIAAPAWSVGAPEPGFLARVRVAAPDQVRVEFAHAPASLAPANFRFTEASAPDVPLPIVAVAKDGATGAVLTIGRTVSASGRYRLETLDPPAAKDVHAAAWAWLLAIVVSSALINNFVFTRYLGLCVFFGVSKKTETAVGMGLTFTAVMVLSAALSWTLDRYALQPLHLAFLQVLVFIGVVAFLVQMLDTILKKTHPALHKKFGIYLVLITTNCIILAVPLLNASSGASLADALALAVGSGVGFALAMFLMSCAREKVELARVPAVFQGLPIAFALAGLFALAFMGFAGLNFLR